MHRLECVEKSSFFKISFTQSGQIRVIRTMIKLGASDFFGYSPLPAGQKYVSVNMGEAGLGGMGRR